MFSAFLSLWLIPVGATRFPHPLANPLRCHTHPWGVRSLVVLPDTEKLGSPTYRLATGLLNSDCHLKPGQRRRDQD